MTVIPIEPTGLGCLYTTATEANWLEVLHSLQLDGFTPSPPEPPLAQAALGSWFTGDGNIGASLALGANGKYIDVSAANGTISVSSGELQDVSAAWSGDGEYVLFGGLFATFPNSQFASPSSALFRRFEEENSSAPSGWIGRLCVLHQSVSGTPYEICYVRR